MDTRNQARWEDQLVRFEVAPNYIVRLVVTFETTWETEVRLHEAPHTHKPDGQLAYWHAVPDGGKDATVHGPARWQFENKSGATRIFYADARFRQEMSDDYPWRHFSEVHPSETGAKLRFGLDDSDANGSKDWDDAVIEVSWSHVDDPANEEPC
jgi:hypothetical protein